MKKSLLIVVILMLVVSIAPVAVNGQNDTIKIGFLPGVVDPFYQVMQIGVERSRGGFRHRNRHPDSRYLGSDSPDAHPRCDGRARRSRLSDHRPD